MADTKLTALTELTTPAGEDLLYTVDDPSGTPLSRKITVTNLLNEAVKAREVSANTTLDDTYTLVNVNTTAAGRTITLPSCSTSSGLWFHIRCDGANDTTVDPGTDTFSDTGSATDKVLRNGEVLRIMSIGGTEWQVVVVKPLTQQVSTATTLNESHGIVNVDTGSGAVTITLPSCATSEGRSYLIRNNRTAGSNNVTVDPGTDTFSDTGTSVDKSLASDGASIGIFSIGGTEWQVVGTQGTVT